MDEDYELTEDEIADVEGFIEVEKRAAITKATSRFQKLKEKLKAKGAKDPEALARYIDKKPYAAKALKRMKG